MWTVYKHTSPSNKVYIGITSREPELRWNNGNGYLCKIKDRYTQPLFANAIIKYGWSNIKHEILFTNLTKSQACEKEIELIKYYKDLGVSYNITDGGEGNLGYRATTESKDKISKALKGRPSRLKGTKRSNEVRLKISIASKKRGVPKDVVNKLHENNKGKHHSEKWKKNIGIGNPRCRRVVQLDTEGNLIRLYLSVREASKANDIPYTSLVQYIKSGKLKVGYYWKYEEQATKIYRDYRII